MKRVLYVCIVALFAALCYSCYDDWSHIWRGEPTEAEKESSVLTLDIDMAKDYLSRIGTFSLPLTNGGNPTKEVCQDSTHVHSDSCRHDVSTRILPDMQKSNIVPLWEQCREWADSTATYVEVPLEVSGGKLYARRMLKRKGEKTGYERALPSCMLVFEQPHGTNKVSCYMVTLIPQLSYQRKHRKEMKTMRHIPAEDFSGVWYKSYLSGRIQSAYYYMEGKRRYKIFSKSAFPATRSVSGDGGFDYQSVNLVDYSLLPAGYNLDWENEEYYCPFCGQYHELDGDGCEVLIEYCSNCGNPVDECQCCYYCGEYPCVCNICDYCGYDPCRCCPGCGEYPCICEEDNTCPECGSDPCICCPNCGTYPCTCEEVIEDDCVGPKCPECGGLIADDPLTRATTNCRMCEGRKCPICGKRHCKEIHAGDCNEVPGSDAMKNSAKELFDLMKKIEKYGDKSHTYSEFEDLLHTNGSNENAITLEYYEDTNSHLLKYLKPGESPYSVEVTTSIYSEATLHNHPNSTPPSGIDLINTAKWAENSNYTNTYIYTNDAMYVLHVENKQKAQNFYKKYSGNLSDTETSMFKSGSELDVKWKDIQKNLKDFSGNDLHLMSLATLLQETDAGIRILKSDAPPTSNGSYDVYYTKVVEERLRPYKCD